MSDRTKLRLVVDTIYTGNVDEVRMSLLSSSLRLSANSLLSLEGLNLKAEAVSSRVIELPALSKEECDPGCPGWAVFNHREIQRCDTCRRFEDDEEAVAHVQKLELLDVERHKEPQRSRNMNEQIVEISREEFDKFEPFRAGAEAYVLEKEWFRDDASNFIGLITQDRADEDWGFVLMGRDQKGKFRAIDFFSGNEKKEEAKRHLFRSMSKYIKSGMRVFPQ